MTLESIDRTVIESMQAGLPLVRNPFQVVAKSVGMSESELIEKIKHMKKQGVIRRIGVAPNHYRLGLVANGMSVWNVNDAVVDKLGKRIGNLSFVSHSYRRPRILPIWPYNLFAMIHGKNREEVFAKRDEIASILGDECTECDILFSKRILKKTGMRLHKKRK